MMTSSMCIGSIPARCTASLIAIPPSSSGEYLGLMAAFAAVIRDAALRNVLMGAQGARELFDIISHVNPHSTSAPRPTADIDR